VLFHRRRAERFAQLLDEAHGGRRHHVRSSVDNDLADVVAVGHRVSALKHSVDVDVDPEFRMGLRAMLVAAAEREGIGNIADSGATVDLEAFRAAASAPKQRARRIRTRGAILAGVAVGAIAISGMSAASENAVPGDALYGVKRSTERAQLALASSDLSKGQLFLDFARNRLAEARAVVESDGFASALDDMDANTTEGVRLLTTTATQRHDTAALDAIDAFLKHQRTEVGGLLSTTADERHERAQDSVMLLLSVEQRVDELRQGLKCGADPKGSDALGPLPAACPPGSAPADRPAGTSQSGDTGRVNEVRPEKTDPRPGASGTPAAPGSAEVPGSSPAPANTPTPAPSKSGNIVEDLGDLLGGIVP
jgi:hypothetical protein